MYALAEIFPGIRKLRLPFSRDQFMLLMLATNELLLGLETYIAHLISGTIVPREWIPIFFGPSAGVLLLLAGVLASTIGYPTLFGITTALAIAAFGMMKFLVRDPRHLAQERPAPAAG